MNGAKFRRQHPVAPYVLDFYCHELKLAIELDGGQHNEEQGLAHDRQRTAFLEAQGITVLRFWNNDVFQQPENVLEAIYHAVVGNSCLPSPPAPLPEGEGSLYQDIPGYCRSVIRPIKPKRLLSWFCSKRRCWVRLGLRHQALDATLGLVRSASLRDTNFLLATTPSICEAQR